MNEPDKPSTLNAERSTPEKKPEIREQHYIDPKTGEKKPLRVKILRGGGKPR